MQGLLHRLAAHLLLRRRSPKSQPGRCVLRGKQGARPAIQRVVGLFFFGSTYISVDSISRQQVSRLPGTTMLADGWFPSFRPARILASFLVFSREHQKCINNEFTGARKSDVTPKNTWSRLLLLTAAAVSSRGWQGVI